jgi:hypothetical protein
VSVEFTTDDFITQDDVEHIALSVIKSSGDERVEEDELARTVSAYADKLAEARYMVDMYALVKYGGVEISPDESGFKMRVAAHPKPAVVPVPEPCF